MENIVIFASHVSSLYPHNARLYPIEACPRVPGLLFIITSIPEAGALRWAHKGR